MPAVVVDTSVLIALAAGEQFGLLKEFYLTIHIPPAVWSEISASAKPFGLPETQQAIKEGWLMVQKPASLAAISPLPFNLQLGETEALALALEMTGALLLIDDAQGRRAAHYLGLHYTGTLGILLRAKTEARLPQLAPVLQLLKQRTSFRLSETVRDAVLRQVGEMPP